MPILRNKLDRLGDEGMATFLDMEGTELLMVRLQRRDGNHRDVIHVSNETNWWICCGGLLGFLLGF